SPQGHSTQNKSPKSDAGSDLGGPTWLSRSLSLLLSRMRDAYHQRFGCAYSVGLKSAVPNSADPIDCSTYTICGSGGGGGGGGASIFSNSPIKVRCDCGAKNQL